MVRDAVAYADEIASDERLRADLRAAMGHGAEASERIRKDIASGSIANRLASDQKLRKKVRAMLDDLDSAGDRMRRRKRHRLRNALLVLGGVGLVVAFLPAARRWLGDDTMVDPETAGEVGVTV
jgi:hypothetical protein